MNDEIKEILEQLEWYRKIGKKDVYYPECVLPNKKAFILLDYITNLQQENERLNQDLSYYQRYGADMLHKNNILEERIEKAVEYINYCDDLSVINDYSFNEKPVIEKRAKKDLLNILNGRSDE